MDKLTPEERSRNMSHIRSKDSAAEMAVRRLVHGMGYRYRMHVRSLPGAPDLVFSKRRRVIFVHGCFWHQHRAEDCRIARVPRSRQDYWLPKLARNVERDEAAQQQLAALGWSTLIVWECEIRDVPTLSAKLREFLGPPKPDRLR